MEVRHLGKKEERERTVFAGFARICPLPIDPGSIQNRKPPQPDIRCSLIDGAELAFELTEILDQSVAARRGGLGNAAKEFEHLVAALPDQAFVKQEYHNAVFRVVFADDSPGIGSRRSMQALLKHIEDPRSLMRIGKDEFVLPPSDPTIRSVSIERGRSDGPHIVVQVGGGFTIPAEQTIKAKLTRSYETDVPIELLIYVDRQPQTGDEAWILSLAKFVADNLGASQFERLWVYDHRHERIMLNYAKTETIG